LRGAGAWRGCDEQALAIPGIAISVDVDIHFFVIHGAFDFVAATIVSCPVSARREASTLACLSLSACPVGFQRLASSAAR
jgi:hypothetical protein